MEVVVLKWKDKQDVFVLKRKKEFRTRGGTSEKENWNNHQLQHLEVIQ
jgi:hypothetical protein